MAGNLVLSGHRTGLLGDGILGTAAASETPLPDPPHAASSSAKPGAAPAARSAFRNERRPSGPDPGRPAGTGRGRNGSLFTGGIATTPRSRDALLPAITVA